MCGIAGIVNEQTGPPITEERLRAQIDVIRHRGPDGEGYYVSPDGRVGLGHARLAVIDLPGGSQPMANEDRSLRLVFNGEIYNFRDLRRRLESLGHVFATQSDSETILHAYEEYGDDCVHHLRGMFAFALWDARRKRLLLARDRLGVKPLWWTRHAGRFYFASEARALLAMPDIPRELNRSALGWYLRFGYVPAPHSLFAGLNKLPPAHRLTLGLDQSEPRIDRYWSLPTRPDFAGSYAEAVEAVREKLTEATAIRMLADVPLGAFLSGGVDSTIAVGLMAGQGGPPVRTFAIGFGSPEFDEREYARQAAERFGTDHTEFVVKPDCLDILPKLIDAYDEPPADSSAIPTLYLARETRRQVTVALSGTGGDEGFGGYDRYRALMMAKRWGWLGKALPKLTTGRNSRSRVARLLRFTGQLGRDPHEQYRNWMSLFDEGGLADLCTPEVGDFSPSAEWFDERFNRGLGAGPAHAAMTCDWAAYLPYDLNVKEDIASMAVGLEVRSPFLDQEGVELAASLPPEWKIRGREGKYILREAFADLLPAAIRRRSKKGFGVPLCHWFRNELNETVRDVLCSRRFRSRGLFRPEAVSRLLDRHLSGAADHSGRLWSLLVLELWHRRWLDGEEM